MISSNSFFEKPTDTTIPAAPSLPVVTASDSLITVSWTAVEGAVSYEVWAGVSDNTSAAVQYGTDIIGGLSVTINLLSNGTTYYVWVKAKNSAGTSGFSLSASATPLAATTAPQVPGKPLLAAGDIQITVSWTAVAGAVSYEVWVGESDNTATAAKYGVDITNGLSVSIGSLSNGTTYYVWVKAKNSVGTSGFSLSASATPLAATTAPQAPGRPLLAAGDTQITVSWVAVEGAASYEVWAGTSSNSTQATKRGGDVSGLSVTIDSLANGTTYYVWAKAKNSAGTSGFSLSASATPLAATTAPQAPDRPLLAAGDTQITASWIVVDGATSYEVWIGESDNTTAVAKYGADITDGLSATIGSLSNGTTYYVWVKAKNSAGTSGFSLSESATPLAATTAPQAPGRPLLAAGDTQITVSWLTVEGVASYEVWVGESDNTTAATQYGADITDGLSATIGSLSNGTTYYVWVKAKNSAGTSGFSPSASGKPIADMGTLTVISGNNQLTVSWAAIAGADEYDVYYSTDATIPGTSTQTVSGSSATITGLTNGTSYNLWVRGKNTTGTGDISAKAEGKPIGTPETPAITLGTNKLTVSWTAVPGADEYEVYYGTPTPPTTLWATVSGTSTTITGLNNGTTYYVRIRGKNSAGLSGWSDTVSGIPAPGAVSITVGFDYGQITITGSDGTNTISRSGTKGPVSLSLSVSGYESVIWYMDGDPTKKISGWEITLGAANYPVRIHSITFTGTKNGVLYSREIPFTVCD
jgi:hypothetical protein